MHLVKAEEFKDHFKCALEHNTSWQVGYTDDGVDMLLRVNVVKNLEGHGRIVYSGAREVTVSRGKEYPMGGKAPYQLLPQRAYSVITEVEAEEDLPQDIVAMVLLEDVGLNLIGGQLRTSLRTLNGLITIDVTCPLPVTLGAMVPFARLRFFTMSDGDLVTPTPEKTPAKSIGAKKKMKAEGANGGS
jgi:hypothetical protein